MQRALGVWDVLLTHCCDSKARAPARERAQRALGVWDVLLMHCCDSKARQHSPSLQCGPKGLPKATKEFEVKGLCRISHLVKGRENKVRIN